MQLFIDPTRNHPSPSYLNPTGCFLGRSTVLKGRWEFDKKRSVLEVSGHIGTYQYWHHALTHEIWHGLIFPCPFVLTKVLQLWAKCREAFTGNINIRVGNREKKAIYGLHTAASPAKKGQIRINNIPPRKHSDNTNRKREDSHIEIIIIYLNLK